MLDAHAVADALSLALERPAAMAVRAIAVERA